MNLLDKIAQKVDNAERAAVLNNLEFPRPTAFISYANHRELRRQLYSMPIEGLYWCTAPDETGTLSTMFFDIKPCAALKDDEVIIAHIEKL